MQAAMELIAAIVEFRRLKPDRLQWGCCKMLRESSMAWIILTMAGVFEIVWAVGLTYTEGFTRLWPSVMTAIAMLLSFALLSHSLKTLPIGTAYAVWTGIGAVGTALVGMLILGEPRGTVRILCILLIVAGIAGLKLTARS